MGAKLRLYSTKTIYFLPVGGKKDCGVLESGGSSPFTNGWNYAFVGVTYVGTGYNYYYISEDDQTNGVPLLSIIELTEGDTSKIYNSHINNVITDEISNKLKELYNTSENKTYTTDLPEDLKEILTPEDEPIEKYIFISGNSCKY